MQHDSISRRGKSRATILALPAGLLVAALCMGGCEQPADTPRPATDPAANRLSGPESEAGWELLFNGRDLDGWRHYGSPDPGSDRWRVEHGKLYLDPGPLGPMAFLLRHLFGTGGTDLAYYPRRYRDFELALEWNISPGGNSGIFYLVDEGRGQAWLSGPEMQVLDNTGHRDGKTPRHRAGDLYDLVAANGDAALPPGQWNRVLIRKQGQRVEHWLNGVQVLAYTYGGPEWRALVARSKFRDRAGYGTVEEGYFVLQDHGDKVWYRNIRARALPAADAGAPGR